MSSIENKANAVIMGALKYLCWIAVVLSLIILTITVLIENYDFDFSLKNFTLFAITSSTCSTVQYFLFLAKGMTKGRGLDEYTKAKKAYNEARSFRREKDVCDFITELRNRDKYDYILKVCSETGYTEKEIRDMKLKGIPKTLSANRRRLISNVIHHRYPNTAPKSSSEVLHVISNRANSRYGYDPKRKQRYLTRTSIQKITITILLLVFTGVLVVEFAQSVNWAAFLLKMFFAVFTFCFSLFGGYSSGLKATGEIEKDSLASMCRFLADMDIWLTEQNRRTRYVPEEYLNKPQQDKKEPS